MAITTSTTKTKRPGPDQRRTEKREQLWPGSAAVVFDLSKAETAGYVRMPRIVPMLTSLLNDLSGKLNAGPLYAALWANDYGQGLVEVRDYRYLLHEAGYDTKGRARRTWNERIAILKKLGCINTATNGIEEDAFIILYNPYFVAGWLYFRAAAGDAEVAKVLTEEWWGLFCERCKMIGVDMTPFTSKAKEMKDLAAQQAAAAAAGAATPEQKEGSP